MRAVLIIGLISSAALLVVIPAISWVIVTLVVVARGEILNCPNCYSSRIRRSLRRIRDNFFPKFIAPCRCESCRKRFYRVQPMKYTSR